MGYFPVRLHRERVRWFRRRFFRGTGDVLKCQLKPFDAASADYAGAVFSVVQVTRLRAVFPDGVCDWTKPGVGQSSTTSGLLDFTEGPGGKPLPAAPVSTPL